MRDADGEDSELEADVVRLTRSNVFGLFGSVVVGWRVVIVIGMVMVMIAVAYRVVVVIPLVIIFMVVRDVRGVASQHSEGRDDDSDGHGRGGGSG